MSDAALTWYDSTRAIPLPARAASIAASAVETIKRGRIAIEVVANCQGSVVVAIQA
jgi:hypothetical protein